MKIKYFFNTLLTYVILLKHIYLYCDISKNDYLQNNAFKELLTFCLLPKSQNKPQTSPKGFFKRFKTLFYKNELLIKL